MTDETFTMLDIKIAARQDQSGYFPSQNTRTDTSSRLARRDGLAISHTEHTNSRHMMPPAEKRYPTSAVTCRRRA